MKNVLAWKEEIEKLHEEKMAAENQLQFAEPNSIKEEYTINKISYLETQINFLIQKIRK